MLRRQMTQSRLQPTSDRKATATNKVRNPPANTGERATPTTALANVGRMHGYFGLLSIMLPAFVSTVANVLGS